MNQDSSSMRKTVWRLAWPVIVQNLLMCTMIIVDTLMLGWHSKTSLAATGIAGPVIWSTLFVLIAISVGALAMVARAVGEGNDHKMRVNAATALMSGLVLGGLVSIVGPIFSTDLVSIFTRETALHTEASVYLRIILSVFILRYLALIGTSILRGAGDTKTPMVIAVCANSVNVLGNYILIFGHFGFMKMGIKGAALATAFASGLECILIMASLFSKHSRIGLRLRNLIEVNWASIKTLWRVSLPAAVEPLMMQPAFLIFTKIVASLGEESLAAHRILITIEMVSLMIGFGFSIACATLVGQKLGAKRVDLAESGCRESIKLALTIMSLFGIIFLLIPKPLISIFTGDASVIELAVICLMIAALEQPATGYTMIYRGALRGAGDTKSPVLVAFVGMWIVRLPLVYILAVVMELGLLGVWLTTPVDWLVRSILFRILYLKGRWKRISL